jgi:polyisoprenoid-binding protein YceI
MGALTVVFAVVWFARPWTSLGAQTSPPLRGAGGREFRIDAAHSAIEFEIPFMYSRVRGRFDEVRGSIFLADSAGGGLEQSSVVAVISTGSINTGSAHRDEHLRSSDFFDTERFPVIVFRSDKTIGVGAQFALVGTLSMHGVTRTVRILSRVVLSPVHDPHNVLIAEITGTTTLARRDFGIVGGDSHNPWFDKLRSATMGDSVRISLEIHAWSSDASNPPANVRATVARIDSIGIDSGIARLRAAFAQDSVVVAGEESTLDAVGQSLLDGGRIRDGFLWLHAVARLLPRSPNAMVSVGRANERMGDTTRAIAWYQQALATDSLDPRAALHLRRLTTRR